MQFAIDENGNRIEAYQTGRAFCPTCDASVIAKCGDIKINHWAHERNCSCDGWNYEPTTQWHLDWQNYFPVEQQEVVIVKNNEKHRADIVTNKGTVIEIQHSLIKTSDIVKREQFYDRMVWIVNAFDFLRNLEIDFTEFNVHRYFGNFIHNQYGNPFKQFRIDLPPDDDLGLVKNALEANGYVPEFTKGEPTRTYTNTRKQFDELLDKDIVNAFYAYYLTQYYQTLFLRSSGKVESRVSWRYKRKCWSVSTKPVYLDLNNGYLFLIKSTNGNILKCRVLEKQTVIQHYKA